MKTLVGVICITQLLGFIIGIFGFDKCHKINIKGMWDRKTTSKEEKLIIKPIAMIISPGVYLGVELVRPSICGE